MNGHVRVEQLGNGLTLVMEPMPGVQSAAFSILVPAGCVAEEAGKNGTAALLSDLLMRGAGERDKRQLSLDLDNLGTQRSEHPGPRHLTLSGATLGENLSRVLDIYADVILEPTLDSDQLESCRLGLEQTLTALEDDPRQKIMYEIRKRTYPAPWGQPTIGTLDELSAITADDVRNHWRTCATPSETIIGIAGHIEPDAILQQIDGLLGNWQPLDLQTPDFDAGAVSVDHIQQDSTQTHIALAWDSVPYTDDSYFDSWAAVSVLSGGSSSRLFTEVRERRGLCYDVNATLHSLKDQARVICYAGSTNERAQETLDVIWDEVQKLSDQVLEDELERCRARAKSSLIMQQESTGARASSIARDWYYLGRVVTLDEINQRIDAVSCESVGDYLKSHPPANLCQLTLGPQPLNPIAAASA